LRTEVNILELNEISILCLPSSAIVDYVLGLFRFRISSEIQFVVLWVIISHRVMVEYQRFGGPCCLHFQGEVKFWNNESLMCIWWLLRCVTSHHKASFCTGQHNSTKIRTYLCFAVGFEFTVCVQAVQVHIALRICDLCDWYTLCYIHLFDMMSWFWETGCICLKSRSSVLWHNVVLW